MSVDVVQLALMVIAVLAVNIALLTLGVPAWVTYIVAVAIGFFWPAPVFTIKRK